MEHITLKANAKVNIALAVNGIREDGYHLIDTVMQSVSLYDKVTIKKSDKITVHSDCGISQEDNIAFSAANLFFEKTMIKGGAEIVIEKKIPLCAGLGGGSADAAAVLKGLNIIYGASLSDDELCKLAIKLGADVPFFIKGGTQRAQGIGEELSAVNSRLKCYIIIMKKGQKPSTKEMYHRLDSTQYDNPDIPTVIKAIEKGDLFELCANMKNCFARVCKAEESISILQKTSPLGIFLSGSGPSVFAVFETESERNKAFEKIGGVGDVFCADFTVCGIETE